jgi:hypothetical protein
MDVDRKLDMRTEKLNRELNALQDLMNEQIASSRQAEQDLQSKLLAVDERYDAISKIVDLNLRQNSETEGRLQEQLGRLENMLIEKVVPDSFYAQTLGSVLGQNVDELKENNFEQLSQQMAERLNEYFRIGIPRAGSLQELRSRADEITAALRDVIARGTTRDPQVATKTGIHLQQAELLLDELNRLQGQLENRQVTIESTLSFPVSAHAEARRSFLDELGRGIKQEIDKWSKPDIYFQGKLERLIRTNLLAVVDTCDEVSPPRSQPELESSLKHLFELAGLRDITPRHGEPFRTAEQDLIQMVAGESGKSLTVAQVVTRGFYYKHRDNETLLRKAGVMVYR